MKKFTMAQAKKECGNTPAEMKHWSFEDIIRSTEANAHELYEQGYFTKTQRDNYIAWGMSHAMRGSY